MLIIMMNILYHVYTHIHTNHCLQGIQSLPGRYTGIMGYKMKVSIVIEVPSGNLT